MKEKEREKMKIIAGIPAYNKQYPVCGVIHAAQDYVDEFYIKSCYNRNPFEYRLLI